MNPGANQISASAHKLTDHLKENHKNVLLNKPLDKPLDLCMTGGMRTLSLESELQDRAKAEATDLKKLRERSNTEYKVMVTRVTSANSLGRFTNDVVRASKDDGGNYTHVEVYIGKDSLASTAQIRTLQISAGITVYDSGSIDAPVCKTRNIKK